MVNIAIIALDLCLSAVNAVEPIGGIKTIFYLVIHRLQRFNNILEFLIADIFEIPVFISVD